MWWITNGSPTIVPTVIRGFSDAYGPWKTICMSRRHATGPSRHADRLPGPVRVAEPAYDRGHDSGGTVGDPPHRHEGRAERAGARTPRPGRSESLVHQPLP